MSYQQFQPHPVLRPYIDAYWIMKGDRASAAGQRIYPDGCIDIIMNMGGEFLANNETFKMKHEAVYLVGTMTRFIDIKVEQDTYLLGIRFKPLGFPVFYQFSSLHEVTNKTVDFTRHLLPTVYVYGPDTISVLDKFYCNKLSDKPLLPSGAMTTIKKKKGIVSISQVARQHFISDRQLERSFKRYLGISPKEYAGFVRYQHAMQLMQTRLSNESLLRVAVETGFYDHAHLTNEIKKYAGLLPSQLKDVGFLQTVSDGSGLNLPL